jgi:peroxiredoxin
MPVAASEDAVPVPALRLICAAFAAGAVLSACTGKGAVANGPQSDDQGYVAGNRTVQVYPADSRVPAPNIEGQSLGGDVINVRDFSGQVVVLNFWASWCPPCRAEQTKLNVVYNATHGKGVTFVGVDIRDEDAAARAFVRTHDVQYPSIVDESESIALGFSPRLPTQPPTTVVIDRSGRVAARITGPTVTGVLQPLVDQLAAETTS